MYTATNPNLYVTHNSNASETVIECISKAREIGKRKKAELEIKLICLLLVIGNLFVLMNMGQPVMNFFGYCLESLVVISAVIILVRGIKNTISFFLK